MENQQQEKNELLFWKVFHNIYLFQYIFGFIEIMEWDKRDEYDQLKTNKKFKNIDSLEWLLKRNAYNLLKCKLKSGENINFKNGCQYLKYFICDQSSSSSSSSSSSTQINILESKQLFQTFQILFNYKFNDLERNKFFKLNINPPSHDQYILTRCLEFSIKYSSIEIVKEILEINKNNIIPEDIKNNCIKIAYSRRNKNKFQISEMLQFILDNEKLYNLPLNSNNNSVRKLKSYSILFIKSNEIKSKLFKLGYFNKDINENQIKKSRKFIGISSFEISILINNLNQIYNCYGTGNEEYNDNIGFMINDDDNCKNGTYGKLNITKYYLLKYNKPLNGMDISKLYEYAMKSLSIPVIQFLLSLKEDDKQRIGIHINYNFDELDKPFEQVIEFIKIYTANFQYFQNMSINIMIENYIIDKIKSSEMYNQLLNIISPNCNHFINFLPKVWNVPLLDNDISSFNKSFKQCDIDKLLEFEKNDKYYETYLKGNKEIIGITFKDSIDIDNISELFNHLNNLNNIHFNNKVNLISTFSNNDLIKLFSNFINNYQFESIELFFKLNINPIKNSVNQFLSIWKQQITGKLDKSFYSQGQDFVLHSHDCLYYWNCSGSGDDGPFYCTSNESIELIISTIKIILNQFKLDYNGNDDDDNGQYKQTIETIINLLYNRLIRCKSATVEIVKKIRNLIHNQSFQLQHSTFQSYYYILLKSPRLLMLIMKLSKNLIIDGIDSEYYEERDYDYILNDPLLDVLEYQELDFIKLIDPRIFTFQYLHGSNDNNDSGNSFNYILINLINQLIYIPSKKFPNIFNYYIQFKCYNSLLTYLLEIKHFNLFFNQLDQIKQILDKDNTTGFNYSNFELLDVAIKNLNVEQFKTFIQYSQYSYSKSILTQFREILKYNYFKKRYQDKFMSKHWPIIYDSLEKCSI